MVVNSQIRPNRARRGRQLERAPRRRREAEFAVAWPAGAHQNPKPPPTWFRVSGDAPSGFFLKGWTAEMWSRVWYRRSGLPTCGSRVCGFKVLRVYVFHCLRLTRERAQNKPLAAFKMPLRHQTREAPKDPKKAYEAPKGPGRPQKGPRNARRPQRLLSLFGDRSQNSL